MHVNVVADAIENVNTLGDVVAADGVNEAGTIVAPAHVRRKLTPVA